MGIFGNTESASQNFVPIKEILDDVIIMKDGTMRAVLMASSSNFALKSAEERASVLYQFQEFLNSLDFSLQINVQSRRFNIEPYLELLKQRLKVAENPLMKTQIEEYIDFVRSFNEESNIMKKSFFMIVPYSAGGLGGGSSFSFFRRKGESAKAQADQRLSEHRTQLNQRVSTVEQGIARCGIRTSRLTGDELIELYNNLFNPGDATTLAS